MGERLKSTLFGLNMLAWMLALCVLGSLIFVLDTGPLVSWIARHKESKLDEAIVAGIVFLLGMSVYFFARSTGLSNRLKRVKDNPLLSFTDRARDKLRRDLVGIAAGLVVAAIMALLFDTGKLVDWLEHRRDTKIDEIIIVSIIFLVGLCFLSVRRWLELTDSLEEYEELHERTSRANRESSVLRELADMLQSCLALEEAHPIVANCAHTLLPESSGALCVTASSRNVVEVVSTWGDPSIAEQVFKPQDCWGLRRGKVHASDNGSASLRCSHLSAELPRHTLCVPMMAHGETLGLLYVDTGRNGNHAQGEGDFAASEQLARSLAEQASLALANLRLREVLRVQSVRDPLTNLYNRRYFEESLQRELARAARKQTSVGLMMLDIDHFKRFNDQYGHDAGDAVLRSFAHMLQSQLRAEDVVCRYGGEEFAVVMPEAPVEACLLRAEQLGVVTRNVIAQLRGQPLEPISISIGVACYPMNGDTGEALLKAADAALYRAKAEGRDRVVAV